jgi:hypothetical protein
MASTGTTGLILTGVSIACTIAVGVAGTSLMEPPLPGPPGASGVLGQLPWSVDLRLSPYLAVGLAAAALAAGTLGLALTLRALRAGWRVNPQVVLVAGVAAAIVAGTTRPFGSSDFLSYAAYGRELVTGHNPYVVAPAALARLGDPVARAVQDWAGTPSVYGALASGVFGFASLVGGASARLTVFVLDLVNAAAFVATGVLLDRLARDRTAARLRAAVLWTCNPLLLQILVAGGHVDALAVAFGVAGIAVAAPAVAASRVAGGLSRVAGGASRAVLFRGVAAGALIGLGFAVKPTVVLIGVGIAIALLTSTPPPTAASPASVTRPPVPASVTRPPVPASVTRPSVRNAANALRSRSLFRISVATTTEVRSKSPRQRLPRVAACGLLAGFAVVAGADLALIGRAGIAQTLRASSMVSVGSPWRVVRTVLSQFMAEPVADQAVRACAVAFALCLAVALFRGQQLCMRVAMLVANSAPAQRLVSFLPAYGVVIRRARARSGPEQRGSWHTAPDLVGLWHTAPVPRLTPRDGGAGRERTQGGAAAGRVAFALVLAWLVAWPYVLPWYDALAWALLPLLPASGFDWVLLARTTALGFGYLPARSAGITIPAGLRWMEPVIRSAVTPAVLAAVAVLLIYVALHRAWPHSFHDS